MAYEQKDGQGSLFKNDKEGVETRADYKGSCTIDGKQYWLDAWIKEGQKGKWMSLSIKLKKTLGATKPERAGAIDDPW